MCKYVIVSLDTIFKIEKKETKPSLINQERIKTQHLLSKINIMVYNNLKIPEKENNNSFQMNVN